MTGRELLWAYGLDGVKIGPVHDAADIAVEHRLQADETLRFTLHAADPKLDWVDVDRRVDYDATVWTVAKRDDTRDANGSATVTFEAHARWYKLADDIRPGVFTLGARTVSQGATTILAGSGWTLAGAPTTGSFTLSETDRSVLELLRGWAAVTGTEIAFDTAALTVTFVAQVGSTRASALRYGRNLVEIARTFEPPKVTKLYARGGGATAAGPLTDYSWYTGQGLALGDAQARFTKSAVWTDTRFVVESNLADAAAAQLAVLAQPIVTYTCKAVDLAALTATSGDDWSIGDSVRVSDPAFNVDVVTRVVRVVRYPQQPARNEVELAYLPKGMRLVAPVEAVAAITNPITEPVYVVPGGSIGSSGGSGCGDWVLDASGNFYTSGDVNFDIPADCYFGVTGNLIASSGDWSWVGATATFASGSQVEFDPSTTVVVAGPVSVEPDGTIASVGFDPGVDGFRFDGTCYTPGTGDPGDPEMPPSGMSAQLNCGVQVGGGTPDAPDVGVALTKAGVIVANAIMSVRSSLHGTTRADDRGHLKYPNFDGYAEIGILSPGVGTGTVSINAADPNKLKLTNPDGSVYGATIPHLTISLDTTPTPDEVIAEPITAGHALVLRSTDSVYLRRTGGGAVRAHSTGVSLSGSSAAFLNVQAGVVGVGPRLDGSAGVLTIEGTSTTGVKVSSDKIEFGSGSNKLTMARNAVPTAFTVWSLTSASGPTFGVNDTSVTISDGTATNGSIGLTAGTLNLTAYTSSGGAGDITIAAGSGAGQGISMSGRIGFFGTAPVAQQATPSLLSEVIDLLQAYGLCP